MASSTEQGRASPYATSASTPVVLPSLGHDDKENHSASGSRTKLSAVNPSNHSLPSSSRAISSGKISRTAAPASSSHRPPAHATTNNTLTATAMSPSRVLRYGETVESLFMVHADSSDEYRQLCLRLIHDNDAAQDTGSWIRVLQLAVQQETRVKSVRAAPDLIRLHRRATTRFALTPQSLPMWLSYAKVQVHQKNDALMTLRHVARVGVSMASFYTSKADLYVQWGDLKEAIKVVQEGIDHEAQPLEELNDKLKELKSDRQQNHQVNSDRHGDQDDADVTERLNNKHAAASTNITTRPSGKRKDYDIKLAETNTENKMQKTAQLSLEQRRPLSKVSKPAAPKGSLLLSSSKRPPLVASKLLQRTGANLLMQPQQEDRVAEETMEEEEKSILAAKGLAASKRKPNVDVNYIKAWDPDKARRSSSEHASQLELSNARSPVTSELPPIHPPIKTTTKMPAEQPEEQHHAAPSSATRQIPNLDLGSILAWQPDTRRMSSEHPLKELDPATPACRVSTVSHESLEQTTRSTVRKNQQTAIPRIDLSYMLEWDPSKRRPSLTTEPIKEAESKEHSIPSLAASTGSVDLDSGKPPKPSIDKQDTATVIMRAGAVTQSNTKHKEELATADLSAAKCRRSVPLNNGHATPSKEDSPMQEYNTDFLSLARQENMLNVNGSSYMKIGVIGKGGSCKVYRALSKEGHVLAIKKVKIAGMQKEAMEGYANEIALLKRLRGSPVIIQLYDSQVDLTQKAILLVMEAGEADLSHVLHQQTQLSNESSGNASRPRLDMNFVRLTWQQMLKAVHCIHEERIVHGDLKPANFLFVRGALKLIDFGIAKAIQSDDTTNIYRDSQIGTVNYMSPESLINETGDKQFKMGRASDIWSLGCILYQMIYGKTPFAELQLMQKLQAIINPNYRISFPATDDESAIDCMKECLRYKAEERPPIVGPKGLLNEHSFLNARR